MRYLTPYRVAAYLLVIFCAGQTAGGMLSRKSLGPESDAVFASMRSVRFAFNGSTVSWYGFWFGFGLMVSVFLLFSAVIAWQLDKAGPDEWPAVAVIAWTFAASQAATAILSWTYFFAGPGVLATAVAVLVAAGAWRKGRGATAS